MVSPCLIWIKMNVNIRSVNLFPQFFCQSKVRRNNNKKKIVKLNVNIRNHGTAVLRYYSFNPWSQPADIYGNKLYIQKHRSKSTNQPLPWHYLMIGCIIKWKWLPECQLPPINVIPWFYARISPNFISHFITK